MARAALLLLMLATTAGAQPYRMPVGPERRDLCVRGRPAPECVTVAIAEVGVGLGTTSEGGREGSMIVPFQVGVLIGTSLHGSVGATLGGVVYEHLHTRTADTLQGSVAGFLRYRRWLRSWSSLDISLGASRSGPIGEIAFQLDDTIALTFGAHAFPVDDRREVAGTVGVRLGGYLIGRLFSRR